MNACIRIIALISLLGLGWNAHADEEFEGYGYGGISYDMFDLKQGSLSVEPSGFKMRLGYQLFKHLGIEGQYGVGSQEDDADNIDVDISNYYGIYLRGTLPLGERLNLFALAGYNSLEVDNLSGGAVGGSADSRDDDDYGYGAGADFEFIDNFFLSVDYMRMLDTDTFEAETLSIGFRYNFS